MYNPNRPFRFGGYVYGAGFGMWRGSKIDYWAAAETVIPEGGDYWFALWNAYNHRYLFRDMRFAVATRSAYTGVGGLGAGPERIQREHDANAQLKEMFGDAIRIGAAKKSHISFRNTTPQLRTITLPYPT